MLFENKVRNRMSPARQGERVFDFYNSSGRDSFRIYRDLLNGWVANYPTDEQAEVISRFRKGLDSQYYATLAEVVVREALLWGGGKLVSHPSVPRSSARPDFRKMSQNDNVEAYVEITTLSQFDREVAGGNRLASIYNLVDDVRLPPGYFFRLSFPKQGSTSPSLTSLKFQIERWLDRATHDIASAEHGAQEFIINDWIVKIDLKRLSDSTIQVDRSVGMYSEGANWLDGSGGIRRRLEGKSSRYGALSAPFLLVVADCKGATGWGESGKRSLIGALFGDESVRVWQDSFGTHQGEFQRNLNGFFGNPSAPKNRNVSAVLLLPQPDLWGLRNPLHQPIFVHHPWAHYRLCASVLPIHSLHLGSDGHLREENARCLADLLSLPTDWPPPF